MPEFPFKCMQDAIWILQYAIFKVTINVHNQAKMIKTNTIRKNYIHESQSILKDFQMLRMWLDGERVRIWFWYFPFSLCCGRILSTQTVVGLQRGETWQQKYRNYNNKPHERRLSNPVHQKQTFSTYKLSTEYKNPSFSCRVPKTKA